MEVGLWLPSRRDLLRVLLLILPLLSPSSAPAQTLTANVEVNGFSFSLGPAATGRFTAFFTTFDGSRGIPLQDCLGGFCTISSEFSPVVNGSTSYRADYIAQSAPGVTLEYGTVAVALSASDSDQDGLLDVLERLSPGNFSLNGTTTPHVNYEVDLLIDEFGAFFCIKPLRNCGPGHLVARGHILWDFQRRPPVWHSSGEILSVGRIWGGFLYARRSESGMEAKSPDS